MKRRRKISVQREIVKVLINYAGKGTIKSWKVGAMTEFENVARPQRN